MKKITNIYNSIIGNVVILSILAFIAALLKYDSFYIKILIFSVPALLFTFKTVRFARFKEVLKFSFILSVLNLLKNFLYLIISGGVAYALVNLFFSGIRILVYALFDLISSFVIFYLVNVIIILLIKLFNKNPVTKKINEFFEYILIKDHYIILCAIIIVFFGINTFKYFTNEKGRFDTITNSEKIFSMEAYHNGIASYKEDKAILFRTYPKAVYYVIDSDKKAITEIVEIPNFKHIIASDKNLTKLNKNEFLALYKKGYHDDNTVIMGIINPEKHLYRNLECTIKDKIIPIPLYIDENKVLIAGNGINDVYTFNGETTELKKETVLHNNYYFPVVTKYTDEQFLVAGVTREKDNYRQNIVVVEKIDLKNKTSEIVFTKEYLDGLGRTIKGAYIYENILALVIKDNHQREKIMNIDLNTFKEISLKDFNVGLSNSNITQLNNGKLLITGGMSGYMKYNKNAYIYDILTEKQNIIKNKTKIDNYDNNNRSTLLLDNGKVLLFNKNKVEMYSP